MVSHILINCPRVCTFAVCGQRDLVDGRKGVGHWGGGGQEWEPSGYLSLPAEEEVIVVLKTGIKLWQ